jgi:hypothetical protein
MRDTFHHHYYVITSTAVNKETKLKFSRRQVNNFLNETQVDCPFIFVQTIHVHTTLGRLHQVFDNCLGGIENLCSNCFRRMYHYTCHERMAIA